MAKEHIRAEGWIIVEKIEYWIELRFVFLDYKTIRMYQRETLLRENDR